MAGSWGHVVRDDGTFRGDALLGNGGDVKECLEEVYGMVWWLTTELNDCHGYEAYSPLALIDEAVKEHRVGWERSPSAVHKSRRV